MPGWVRWGGDASDGEATWGFILWSSPVCSCAVSVYLCACWEGVLWCVCTPVNWGRCGCLCDLEEDLYTCLFCLWSIFFFFFYVSVVLCSADMCLQTEVNKERQAIWRSVCIPALLVFVICIFFINFHWTAVSSGCKKIRSLYETEITVIWRVFVPFELPFFCFLYCIFVSSFYSTSFTLKLFNCPPWLY